MNWTDIITILFGTGIITTLAQYFLTNNLNKRFFRFSNLYKDKIDIIKELYKLLIKAEQGVKILMFESKPEIINGNDGKPDQESTKNLVEFNLKTHDAINSFFDFFDQNEIVFEDEIVQLINRLKEEFNKVENNHTYATMWENSRGSKAWDKAMDKKSDLYELSVLKEIPKLKNELKIFLQKQYKILNAN